MAASTYPSSWLPSSTSSASTPRPGSSVSTTARRGRSSCCKPSSSASSTAVGVLKIRYQSLKQTWRYADAMGAEEAHLVIFDRRPKVAWSKKIWQRNAQHAGMAITVWGM